jgi:uncharacterized protein
MTEHETALVAILLERLKKVDSAPKDAEAETLIRQMTADQPDSAYHLVQTVLIQDLSLHVAQTRINELEKSLADAETVRFLPLNLLGRAPTPNPKAVEAT